MCMQISRNDNTSKTRVNERRVKRIKFMDNEEKKGGKKRGGSKCVGKAFLSRSVKKLLFPL